MAIRKIAQTGNPVLRKKAELVPLENIDSSAIQSLIDDMIDAKEEYHGAGLAAPQIHESLQIIVVGIGDSERYPDSLLTPDTIIINPKVASFSQDMDEDWEGCLSLNDLWGMVKRSNEIVVEGYNREGGSIEIQAKGFTARVFQHEIDHLYGKLFVDRMSSMDSLSFGPEFRRYSKMLKKEELL